MNNGKDKLEKFDAKFDDAILFYYSSISKVFRIFNKRILIVEESIHVIFDVTNDFLSRKREIVDYTGLIVEGMNELILKDSML